jgi:hypothetical protein
MAENNIKAEITKARKEKEAIDKLLKEKVYQLFQQEVEELFREHPDLESFTWSQYTPYFNDGDECVFSVNRESIGINGEEMEYFGDVEHRANRILNREAILKKLESDIKKIKNANEKGQKKVKLSDGHSYDDYSYSWILKDKESELKATAEADENDLPALQRKIAHTQAVGKLLNNYTDDDLLDMFEDHAQVTVTRKGATTEYYNHD